MPDLKDQLHNYIEGLAEPVSVHESMSPTTRSARSYPAPIALLAGAAVVLLPALLLIGIRWWPGNTDPVAPSAPPPMVEEATTTTSPTTPETTAAVTPTPVSVPDLNGLTAEEATSVLTSVGLELEIVEMYPSRSGFGLITAQEPLAGETAQSGDSIQVGVRVQAPCLTPAAPAEAPEGSMPVSLLFECAGDGLSPDISAPITRVVPTAPDIIEATLTALLAGPTDEERTMGYSSFFSIESANALNSTTVDGSRLIVDFNEDILIGNASTSTGSQYFLAELSANLYQFPELDSIEYRLNGSCDAFYNWLQGSCQVSTRAEWEQRLTEWDAARELAAPGPGSELAVNDIVGRTFSAPPTETPRALLRIESGDAASTPFTEVGHWLVEDSGNDIPATWALQVTGLNEEMIWLGDSADVTNEGPAMFEVRAVLVVPWEEILPSLRADAFLLNGTDSCTRNGDTDPRLVVVAELAETAGGVVTGATEPLRAWLVDVADAVIEEIATDGVECLVDFG